MTLVASEISRHGIVMVGDSAITLSNGGKPVGVRGGAAKVHYADASNIGFAVWGNALVGDRQIDRWIGDFIADQLKSKGELDDVAEGLAEQLGSDLRQEGRPWHELRCGIHIAGYYHGLPRLWHVHCGHPDEEPHEPRVYRDYPEDRGWSDEDFRVAMFSEGGTMDCHLRNGYTAHYGLLFENVVNYSNSLRENVGVTFPRDSLIGHLEFHKVLVRFVAGVLVAAGEHPGVNDSLSAVAFNDNGIQCDERLPIVQWHDRIERQARGHLTFGGRDHQATSARSNASSGSLNEEDPGCAVVRIKGDEAACHL